MQARGSGAEIDLDRLMREYQAGRSDAFEEIFRALSGPLFQYLNSRLLDVSRSEDLLQETFLQIHRARATYRPGRSVRAWAFGVARHVFLMDRRKQGRLHRHEVPAENALEYLPAPQVDQTVHDRQLVRSVLSRLTPDQREILLLRHNWGFTFKEIGAILGIRETTAKLRAFRAGRTFRSILEAQNVTLKAAEANESTG